MVEKAVVAASCLGAALLATALPTGDGKRMDEDEICRKLEDCYKSVKSAEREKDKHKVFDIEVERLAYLVLVAGSRANGSRRLDAVFTTIQKESPTLVVPRFVMTPAELEKLIDGMATDNADDLVYSAYRKKVRTMSEWIADAKRAITHRSGFKFDPSVPVIRTQ